MGDSRCNEGWSEGWKEDEHHAPPETSEQAAREARKKELLESLERSIAKKYAYELYHAGFFEHWALKRRINAEVQKEQEKQRVPLENSIAEK